MIKILTLLALTSCASVSITPIAISDVMENCDTKIFTSKQAATEKGEIEEMCIITNSVGLGILNKSLGHAINSTKNQACRCGTDLAYIKLAAADALMLVAFRYKDKK